MRGGRRSEAGWGGVCRAAAAAAGAAWSAAATAVVHRAPAALPTCQRSPSSLLPSPLEHRISIYKGDVVLKNLRLRPDALAELDLPITVRAGLLGSLTLKVRQRQLSAAASAADDGVVAGVSAQPCIPAAWHPAGCCRLLQRRQPPHPHLPSRRSLLQVPWSSLGAVPVEAKLDRLFLLASPKTEEERGEGVCTEVGCLCEGCFCVRAGRAWRAGLGAWAASG